MNNTAEVYMWGTRIGIIHLEEGEKYASFEYDSDFAGSRIEVSPIRMPLSRTENSFNVIDRLCYTGSRGMGALEYVPTTGPKEEAGDIVRIDRMVEFASNILKNRERAHLHMDDNISAKQLLLLGTSAGGARAKAVIAWNEETGDIRSGQIPAGKGYGYWIIKFDGVDSNGDQMIKSFFDYAQGE